MIEQFKVTLAAWATAAQRVRTLLVQLRGRGATGADDRAEGFDGVEAAQPLGLRVRPVLRDSLEAFAVEYGDERVALFLVDKGRRTGAVEPEAGGATLHGLAEESAVVYIRASGAIEITPKAGQNVVLAGGVLSAARTTDAVQTVIDAVAAGGITAPPGGGPCTLTAGDVTLSGTITGAGAPNVKA
jgi:hypothetical protein